jgi:hypothetical protein
MMLPRQKTTLSAATESKLVKLRQMLVEEREPWDIANYFHEELIADDDFLLSGAPAAQPRLTVALEAALRTLAPRGKLLRPYIIRVPQLGMCHGYAKWGSGQALFIYFEDPDIGLCSYAATPSSRNVSFARLRVADAMPSWMWGLGQTGTA